MKRTAGNNADWTESRQSWDVTLVRYSPRKRPKEYGKELTSPRQLRMSCQVGLNPMRKQWRSTICGHQFFEGKYLRAVYCFLKSEPEGLRLVDWLTILCTEWRKEEWPSWSVHRYQVSIKSVYQSGHSLFFWKLYHTRSAPIPAV